MPDVGDDQDSTPQVPGFLRADRCEEEPTDPPLGDPWWEQPGALLLTDGREALFPNTSVKQLRDLVRLSRRSGIAIGDEVDPRDVAGYGPIEDRPT